MRKSIAIVALALVSAACGDWPWETQTGPTQTTIVTINPSPVTATPSPASTPSPGCAAVATVGVSARDANNVVVGSGNTSGQLIVGQTYSLDASPKDANGRLIEPSSCHAPAGEWIDTPTGIVSLLGDTKGFNPRLIAVKAGDVVVRFTLGAGAGQGLYGEMRFKVIN